MIYEGKIDEFWEGVSYNQDKMNIKSRGLHDLNKKVSEIDYQLETINDKKIKSFDESLNSLLLNLAKRVVADGEGASKFITIDVLNSKSEQDAKKIGFSIANSPLVKTAIAGEDPNWGRIIMAIGKSDVDINLNKLTIKFGDLIIVSKGKIHSQYNESDAAKYMKGLDINLSVDIGNGKKNFTVYTMDLTNEYIKINSDYRS